jgi:WD40 repeat protein
MRSRILTEGRERGEFTAVAFSPDGRPIATASRAVLVWDVTTGSEIWSRGGPAADHGLAFSPDGMRLAVAGWRGGAVKILDAATGKEIRSIPEQKTRITGLAFCPDGRRLAIAADGLKVWDTVSGKELLSLPPGQHAVAFAPDGKRIATASRTQVILRDAQNGTELLVFSRHTNDVSCVVFSPDGNRLASVSADATLQIWDTTLLEPERERAASAPGP